MTFDKSESINNKLAKAHECVAEVVDYHIGNKLWNTSANRLYYACFHAVSALLLSKDITSKTHSGTRQMFGLNFIKTGLLDEKYGELYTTLFHMRQSADYEDAIDYEEHDILPLTQPVEELISAITKMLSSEL